MLHYPQKATLLVHPFFWTHISFLSCCTVYQRTCSILKLSHHQSFIRFIQTTYINAVQNATPPSSLLTPRHTTRKSYRFPHAIRPQFSRDPLCSACYQFWETIPTEFRNTPLAISLSFLEITAGPSTVQKMLSTIQKWSLEPKPCTKVRKVVKGILKKCSACRWYESQESLSRFSFPSLAVLNGSCSIPLPPLLWSFASSQGQLNKPTIHSALNIPVLHYIYIEYMNHIIYITVQSSKPLTFSLLCILLHPYLCSTLSWYLSFFSYFKSSNTAVSYSSQLIIYVLFQPLAVHTPESLFLWKNSTTGITSLPAPLAASPPPSTLQTPSHSQSAALLTIPAHAHVYHRTASVADHFACPAQSGTAPESLSTRQLQPSKL